MDDSPGVTLDQYLKRKGGKIEAEWAVRILTPVMNALPPGPIHPDTVFLSNQGRVEVLEAPAPDAHLKPGYAAPELYQPNAQPTPPAAVYALGATLYRAITGWAPPHAASRLQGKTLLAPSDLGVALQPHVEAALMKALALEPVYRFRSIAEFQAALSGAPLAPQGADPHVQTKPIPVVYDFHKAETKPMTAPPMLVANTPQGKLPLWLIAIICGVIVLVGYALFKSQAGPGGP